MGLTPTNGASHKPLPFMLNRNQNASLSSSRTPVCKNSFWIYTIFRTRWVDIRSVINLSHSKGCCCEPLYIHLFMLLAGRCDFVVASKTIFTLVMLAFSHSNWFVWHVENVESPVTIFFTASTFSSSSWSHTIFFYSSLKFGFWLLLNPD